MTPGMTFLREAQSLHPRFQNHAELGKTGRNRSPKPSQGQEPGLGDLLVFHSPSHLFLHLVVSEVQCQEVEVLRLLPLSGVGQEEDGGSPGRIGGGGREGLFLGQLPTCLQTLREAPTLLHHTTSGPPSLSPLFLVLLRIELLDDLEELGIPSVQFFI